MVPHRLGFQDRGEGHTELRLYEVLGSSPTRSYCVLELPMRNGEIGFSGEDNALVVRIRAKRLAQISDQGFASVVTQGPDQPGERRLAPSHRRNSSAEG